MISAPEPLRAEHALSAFCCGVESMDTALMVAVETLKA